MLKKFYQSAIEQTNRTLGQCIGIFWRLAYSGMPQISAEERQSKVCDLAKALVDLEE